MKTDTRPFLSLITSSNLNSEINSGSFAYPDAFCVRTKIMMGCCEIVGSERRRFSSTLESGRTSSLRLSTKQAIPRPQRYPGELKYDSEGEIANLENEPPRSPTTINAIKDEFKMRDCINSTQRNVFKTCSQERTWTRPKPGYPPD
jgi:hypothetical protein